MRRAWTALQMSLVGLTVMAMLAGCTTKTPVSGSAAAEEIELIVFAASSLTDAFDEIAHAFEAHNPGVTVLANYGGSSGLATQLLEGAPADVFASANASQMQNVVDGGRVTVDPPTFAINRLVLIVPADNPAGLTTPADLAQSGIKLVLATPGVPVRDYADQVIEKLAVAPGYPTDFADAVYTNLVSEEDNVRQVAAKVALGEADAGIVYTSDVTPDIADDVLQIAIADEFNVVASYPIAPLTDAVHPEVAARFVDFVLSREGQSILARRGFGAAVE
ncbi:MAG: molybdate ABC transporter substrate-binding protein [Caldilineaceae bacterium]